MVELDASASIGFINFGYDNVYLNHLVEAEDALRRAAERKVEMPDFLVLRYDMAFLKSDNARMARQIVMAQSDSGAEDWMSHHQAFVLAYSGRLREARRVSAQASDWRSRRVIANEQLCLKPEEHYGKRSSGTPPLPGGARRPHSSLPRTGR